MLPVDTTMAVMCHVLFFVCCMHVHGSGCRSDYCMFSRSVDTMYASCGADDVAFRAACRRARLVALLSRLESSYSMSPHELIAAMCYDQLRCLAIVLWRCLIVLKFI